VSCLRCHVISEESRRIVLPRASFIIELPEIDIIAKPSIVSWVKENEVGKTCSMQERRTLFLVKVKKRHR
jgi:hypothetical protein